MIKVERVWPEQPEQALGTNAILLEPRFLITPDSVTTADEILARLAHLQLDTLDNGDGTIIATAREGCEPNVPELTEAITGYRPRHIQLTGPTKRSPHVYICVTNFWPVSGQEELLLRFGVEIHARGNDDNVPLSSGDCGFALTTSIGDTLPPPWLIAKILEAELLSVG